MWLLLTQKTLMLGLVLNYTCCDVTGVADNDLGGGGVAGQAKDLSRLFEEPLVAAMNVFVSGACIDFTFFASFKFW